MSVIIKLQITKYKKKRLNVSFLNTKYDNEELLQGKIT